MNSKPLVLVVDDEQINVDVLVSNLSELYDTKVAFNGEQALKILDKISIDLVLLDIHMPNMNGYDVAKYILSNDRTKSVPFIFLTADVSEESIIKGFKAGARDYMTKPFNVEELLVRVDNHIKIHQLQKEVLKREKYLELILNKQPSMILITDGYKMQFVNKTLLQFFDIDNIDDFNKKIECISHKFIQDKKYFSCQYEDINWIKKIQELPLEKRVVLMNSEINNSGRIFGISITELEKDRLYIVNFNDISYAVNKQYELEDQMMHDSLTGALNRHFFEKEIDKVIFNNSSKGLLTAISILDIDHFKQVNDVYGHDVGDNVLQQFVKVIHQFSRKIDIVFRWGGEEFLFIFPIDHKDLVSKVLNNLKENIAKEEFVDVGHKTASFGATIYKTGEDIHDTIKRADLALYKSKNSGRNCINIIL